MPRDKFYCLDYDKQNCNQDNLITLCSGCNLRANWNRTVWQNFYRNLMRNILCMKKG